ncbi:MAG: 7-carboxy-7-deazaguanine synthase QueE [Planctomycetota bacterium]
MTAARTSPASDALVSETFVSVQGEGKLTGVPSWFLRLSGCNLRCKWCDTPYASWNPEGDKRSIESLVDEAKTSGVRHAVLTGGEPMIFPQLPAICAGLRAAGIHITIETAGTVFPNEWHDLACDLISISPKLGNSTPKNDERDPLQVWTERHEQRRLNIPVLNRLLAGFPDRQLKFVVALQADLAEIDDLLNRLSGFETGDVMLMPEGTSVPDPSGVRWVVETCLEHGWRYCHRLHIELFGDTRGT